jgi:hypothetical protein
MPASSIRPLRAWAAALAGFALAMAAAWPGGATIAGMPARRLVLALPAWAPVALSAAMAAATLALLASLLPPPRRKDPDEPEHEPPPPPRLSPWVLVALFAGLIAAVAAVLWAVHLLPPAGGRSVLPHLSPPAPAPPRPPAGPRPAPLLAAGLTPVLTVVFAALAALLAAAGAWLVWENRWTMVHAPRRRRVRLARALHAATGAGEQALLRGGDPRATVIACYRRCERAVMAGWRRRYPWQTPREYIGAAMAALDLPPDAVAALLHSFERARYGALPVGGAERAAALRAMAAIRAALARSGGDG